MNLQKRLIILTVSICVLLIAACGTRNPSVISSEVDFGKNDYQKIVSSNNHLGFELLSEAGEDGDGNIFISPTSLLMALSMVHNGADGLTKEEIANVLHAQGIDVNELNKANASLMSILHRDSKEIQLNVANSIWINENFHFQNDFAQNNRDYFNAEIQEINISDSKSPKRINEWVKKSTNNRIQQIVASPLDPDLVAVLINAIYFKGNWKHKFEKEQTEERTFYLQDGTQKEIPLMTLNKKLAYLENEHFQAVSLPYGDSGMSMKIFLPNENGKFKELLTNENWGKWNTEFVQEEGTILLPRFQLEYEVELNEALKNLGMTSAFQKDANFTKMIVESDPIWISKVKQKTFIDVNEEGTEAAAATSIEMATESAPMNPPFYMEINRPFFIAITDDKIGAILFMGTIANPQEEK